MWRRTVILNILVERHHYHSIIKVRPCIDLVITVLSRVSCVIKLSIGVMRLYVIDGVYMGYVMYHHTYSLVIHVRFVVPHLLKGLI